MKTNTAIYITIACILFGAISFYSFLIFEIWTSQVVLFYKLWSTIFITSCFLGAFIATYVASRKDQMKNIKINDTKERKGLIQDTGGTMIITDYKTGNVIVQHIDKVGVVKEMYTYNIYDN